MKTVKSLFCILAALFCSTLAQSRTGEVAGSAPGKASLGYAVSHPQTKTMYDPCPAGYHVPNPVDIYAIRASGSHSFLKAGARWYDLDPAVPDKVGEFGYYWTALADKDSGSRSVDFYIWNVGTGLAMKSHYYIGSAFPIRPQKF